MGRVIWLNEWKADHQKRTQLCPVCLADCWLRWIGVCK